MKVLQRDRSGLVLTFDSGAVQNAIALNKDTLFHAFWESIKPAVGAGWRLSAQKSTKQRLFLQRFLAANDFVDYWIPISDQQVRSRGERS